MSVLIKGMRMPQNCVDCELYDLDSEQCPIYAIYKEDYSDKRFEKCPLVEVPIPHGRLIDWNLVREDIIHQLGIADERYLMQAERAILKIIDYSPAVIEAEE